MPIYESQALEYASKNKSRFLNELKDFISLPSISTNPAAKTDMHRAAEWVADQLLNLGMNEVEIMATGGHPIVFGESLSAGPEKPTVLIYGHYDVQPAEPLELWDSPAFSPTQRGENLYGRGASDMKGQIVVSLKSLESLVQTVGWPINVKFLIEGEEEIGSPNLEGFIKSNKELLACDFAINPDAGMISADLPTITYGLRGLAYFELRVSGPQQDLHSGLFGGTVHNPAQVLCELIAGMHDEFGRITLPGFYDSVQPIEESERIELARLPMDEDFYITQTGVPALYGEMGYTPVEQVGARPTLEVNGILSGFTGEGSKTVLPSKAMAKISMRLVPEQNPDSVHQQLIEYLKINAPETVNWEVIKLASGPYSITDRNIHGVMALCNAMETTWGIPPVFSREGGSIPVVGLMQKELGIESVLTGFGLSDDNLHAPNEKIHLPTFFRGIDTFIRYFSILSE
ncbi:dipeptidase [Chloroflexota bacterium]